MNDIALSVASAKRVALLEIEGLASDAQQLMFDAHRSSAIASDQHHRRLQQLCVSRYRMACEGAARRLAAIKGRSAKNRSFELQAALLEVIEQVMSVFDANDGTGSILPKPVAARAVLNEQLLGVLQSTLDDLALGVFLMTENQPGRSGSVTNITFHGTATGIAIATDGAWQRIEGGQNVSVGISLGELLKALDQIEEMVAETHLSAEERDAASDAIVNAKRELKALEPDAGRLKRFLAACSDWAAKVGASAAGGVIARAITLLAGMG